MYFPDLLRRRLLDVGVDVAVQSDDLARLSRRLIVFDMDSTLILQEVKILGILAR